MHKPLACAFVAGATGYTGRAVVEGLRARGIRTVAHIRPDSPRLAEWQDRFSALGATPDACPWQVEALQARLEELKPTLIFALLGTTRARARAGRSGAVAATYEAVDYGLTAMLLEASRALSPPPCLVYLSSLGAEHPRGNSYLSVRYRLEAEIRASGIPFVLARPGIISGPDREETRPAERLGARVSDGVLDLLGMLGAGQLRSRYHSLSGKELAEGLIRAGLDPACHGLVLGPLELRGTEG